MREAVQLCQRSLQHAALPSVAGRGCNDCRLEQACGVAVLLNCTGDAAALMPQVPEPAAGAAGDVRRLGEEVEVQSRRRADGIARCGAKHAARCRRAGAGGLIAVGTLTRLETAFVAAALGAALVLEALDLPVDQLQLEGGGVPFDQLARRHGSAFGHECFLEGCGGRPQRLDLAS